MYMYSWGSIIGNFLENDFWPPPPINFVHGYHVFHMENIGHVAPSARSPGLS